MTERVSPPTPPTRGAPAPAPPAGAAPAAGALFCPSHRTERRLAAGALAAELGHELQGPLNLFRSSAERLAQGQTLDTEDLALLGEELERMSRLSRRLRELSRVTAHKTTCSPRQLLELALGGSTAELEIEVRSDVSLVCDATLLSQALRELCDNALEAKAQRAGVRFEVGAAPGFCVWDDGPGFALSLPNALAWGVTTRPFASGLGLTVALRAARAHGFDLELRRTASHTEAWLLIPERALSFQVQP